MSIPSYQVVALRMELAGYGEERRAWERLGAFMRERKIAPSEPYTEYCEFCDEGAAADAGGDAAGGAGDAIAAGGAPCGAPSPVTVEVAVATDAHGEDDGPLRFYRSAALPLAASIKVYGPYENIAPVYASFARWLEDHPALRMAGPTREVAHRGPWNAEDSQDYLTEFLVPVQKTA